MAFYMFWQPEPDAKWEIALASERANVIAQKQPKLVSVLDVDYDFSQDIGAEEKWKLKYQGDVYFDFDCGEGQTAADVIPKVIEFLTNLRDKGVSLDSLRLFATGGKGFHVEMPIETVLDRVPRTGITMLPYIIKEFAYSVYVDTLDLRVYTGGRGRMWRAPNVLRPNGKYKVPVTAAEIFSMTGEAYAELCSAPRLAPQIEPPVFNPTLAVLFSMATDKVTDAMKKRKAGKADTGLIKQFKGEWPETVKSIMAGENLVEGVGFQRIAMQLAITAHALGKSEKDLLRECEGLCDKHRSDGSRYNSFKKREHEISRMYYYMAGNPCYEFSVGSLKSLMKADYKNDEFDHGEWTPDEDEDQDQEGETEPSVGRNIKINRGGFFVKGDNGFIKASDMGMGAPLQLRTLSEEIIGYEVEVFVEGKSRGAHPLTIADLQTKAKFMAWASAIASTSVQASDAQVATLMDILRRKSEQNGKVVHIISREGIDVIPSFGSRDVDIVWAARDQVISRHGWNYRFRGNMTQDKELKSDLHHAPMIQDTQENRDVIHSLLRINSPENIAKLLGWFFAAFLCQPIRTVSSQFPSLQVFGQAGAGKSATVELMAHLHYYAMKPELMQASTGATNFPLIAAVAQSASVPVIFEEVKPREMSRDRLNYLRDLLRNNYTGASIQRGRVNRDTISRVEVIKEVNSAPLAFIGEMLETQTAILERCVVVAMSKESRLGRGKHMETVLNNPTILGQLGRVAVDVIVGSAAEGRTEGLSLEKLRATLKEAKVKIRDRMGGGDDGKDRPYHNLAVVLSGLEFAKRHVIGRVFGTHFDEDFDMLIEALLNNPAAVMVETMSEASKTMDVLARMSHGTGDDTTTLFPGQDYLVSEDGKSVDLKIKQVYDKYSRYCRTIGQQPLYDNVGGFVAGMKHYSACVDQVCSNNQILRTSPLTMVFRFSVASMEAERVEPFRRK